MLGTTRLPGHSIDRRLFLAIQMKLLWKRLPEQRLIPNSLRAILLSPINDTYFAFHRVKTICFGYPVASDLFPEQRHYQSRFLKVDFIQSRYHFSASL